jgi:hypothetical protein
MKLYAIVIVTLFIALVSMAEPKDATEVNGMVIKKAKEGLVIKCNDGPCYANSDKPIGRDRMHQSDWIAYVNRNARGNIVLTDYPDIKDVANGDFISAKVKYIEVIDEIHVGEKTANMSLRCYQFIEKLK